MTLFHKPFNCSECGGWVNPSPGRNRTYNLFSNEVVPIPNDFLIPTCEKCGEEFMDLPTTHKLYSTLIKDYYKKHPELKDQTLEKILVSLIHASKEGIEVCDDGVGVTFNEQSNLYELDDPINPKVNLIGAILYHTQPGWDDFELELVAAHRLKISDWDLVGIFKVFHDHEMFDWEKFDEGLLEVGHRLKEVFSKYSLIVKFKKGSNPPSSPA